MNNINSINRKYSVLPNCWYKITVLIEVDKAKLKIDKFFYKFGSLKIVSADGKVPIFPIVKLPNILFSKLNKIDNVNALEKLEMFNIYFNCKNNKLVFLYFNSLNLKLLTFSQVQEDEVKKEIDLWRYRRLYDLEFINYYLNTLYTNYNNIFVDRFQAEYKLYKNINYFDQLLSTIKINLNKEKPINEKNKIMYLLDSNILYEENGQTLKQHNLMKNFNKNNESFEILGVTKYGYPFDRNMEYYKKKVNNSYEDVVYIKLVNKDDNINSNNLIEYLKKYIIETIKIANNLGINIIHSTHNYINGLAGVYAAKYLDIKCIYEYTNDTNLTRPEIYDSDLYNLKSSFEKLIMSKANKIIVNNYSDKLYLENIFSEHYKIIQINNGFNYLYDKNTSSNPELNKDLFEEYDLIIGYLGKVDMEMYNILKILLKLKNQNINFKLVIFNDFDYNEKIIELMKKEISDNFILVNNIEENMISEYLDIMDVLIIPKAINNYKQKNFVLLTMKHGKIILLNKHIELYDFGNENEHFLVYEDNNLIDKIFEIYKNQESREMISNNCIEYVQKNFLWENIIDKLVNMYNNL